MIQGFPFTHTCASLFLVTMSHMSELITKPDTDKDSHHSDSADDPNQPESQNCFFVSVSGNANQGCEKLSYKEYLERQRHYVKQYIIMVRPPPTEFIIE